MNEYDIVITKTNSYESYGKIFADSYSEIDEYIASLLQDGFVVIQSGYDANSMITEYIRKDLIETVKVTLFSEGVILDYSHPMMQVGLLPRQERMRIAGDMMRSAYKKEEVKE